MPQQVPRPGDVIEGRYRIDKVLGHGGFSVVFRATQLAMDRAVALKALLPDALGEEMNVGLFEREASFAKRLQHPHIIELYDFGQSQGMPFIVMEMLKGEALSDRVRRGPLPARDVARITRDALKALMASHNQGVIHRDIKPSNLFLCEYAGAPDFVKVIDFGIARAFHDPQMDRLVPEGAVLGTPLYIAPEQVRGEGIGPHTDLYALGLMMAHLLIGEAIFGHLAVPLDVVRQQMSREPIPLPDAVLDGPLGNVVEKAVRKDYTHRYESAAQMLQDVEEVLEHDVVAPRARVRAHRREQQHDTTLREGDVLDGHWSLDELIGERLFSVVFRGTQLSLGRTVAIKALLPSYVKNDDVVDQFQREVQTVSLLHDPHTIRILEAGRHPVPFLVTEWLRGEPLSTTLQRRALGVEAVRDIGLQVLEALIEAHGNGVIHGNLKPANVFLCRTVTHRTHVKLTDFSVTRSYVGPADQAVEGQDGLILGTPRYMPREQLLQAGMGPSTDLYALGLLMAEALTGRPVYGDELEPLDIARQQLSPRPHPFAPEVLRGRLGPVIETATRKRIDERFETAAEMHLALSS